MDRKKRELRGDGKATAEAASARIASASSGETPGVETPLKTEELFRHGEALFELGNYEDAIHVWTRILFLERGDTRAKNAIERAKGAVSERQRELEAKLADASRLVDAGELDEAESKVRHVLELDPRQPEAHQLAERIAARGRRKDAGAATTPVGHAEQREGDVLDAAASTKRGLLLRVSRASSPPLSVRANTSPLKMAGFVLGVVLVFASGALFLHLNWESIVSDESFVTGAVGASSGGLEPMDARVPGPSELHYYNGATLYAEGRYREALAELSRVEPNVGVSERARSLILRIEERLLRGGEGRESETPARASGSKD